MWRPIEEAVDLPPAGARETLTCDFKARPSNDDFEIAKDVAAFANASGGTLLVGAAGGDHLERWLPLRAEESRNAQRVYELAIRDRCRPAPIFGVVDLAVDSGRILAVNVWPFLGQLVGVRLKAGEARCGPNGKEPEAAFLFPLRIGTDTRAILPEQFPMFADPKLRRIALHLENTVGHKAILIATRYRQERGNWFQPVMVETVDLHTNTMTVAVPMSDGIRVIPIPLDAVETVSRAVHTTSPLLANFQTYFDPLG